MAILHIPDHQRRLTDPQAIAQHLAGIGVSYEVWTPAHPLAESATSQEVLAAYDGEIRRLAASGGYLTADVIDVRPETPGLDAMLARFREEHWHDEDEVRFILAGRGVFHIRPMDDPERHPVVAVEVTAGDLLRVPRGTWHWFDLCGERRVRAIRLFQDPAGWTPHYTKSGIDARYQPLCFGPAWVDPARARS
jgi:1,2-dihydroxy-3-keto-5-methylthiopentene dioxygenase